MLSWDDANVVERYVFCYGADEALEAHRRYHDPFVVMIYPPFHFVQSTRCPVQSLPDIGTTKAGHSDAMFMTELLVVVLV